MKPLAARVTAAQDRGAREVEATQRRLDAATTARAAAAKVAHTADIALEVTTSSTTEGALEKLVRARELASLRVRHTTTDEEKAQRAVTTAQREATLWIDSVFEEEALETGIKPLLVLSEEIKVVEERLKMARLEQLWLLQQKIQPYVPGMDTVNRVEVTYGGALTSKDQAFSQSEAASIAMQMIATSNPRPKP